MNKFFNYVFIVFYLLISGCKKDPDPVVLTVQNNDNSFTYINTSNSILTADIINSLFTFNNQLYIGTDNELLKVSNGFYNKIGSFTFINDVESNDSILFCATNNGLLKISSTDTIVFTSQNSLLPLNKVRSLALADSILWIGTYSGGGLCKYNFVDDSWVVYTPSNSGLPNNSVSDIVIGNNNDIWVGVPGGLVQMDMNSNFTVFNQSNSTISSSTIKCIEKRGNQIWVGHNAGISVYESGVFKNFSMTNSSLSFNIIQDIYIDNDKAYIGTGGQGLDIMNLIDSSYTHYNTSNSNLSDNYINTISRLNTKVYLGTDNGISVLEN